MRVCLGGCGWVCIGMAELFLSDRDEYDRQAAASVDKYAKKTVKQWLEEFDVDLDDTPDNAPPALRCPLTDKLFVDPVAARGQVYSRQAIEAYIKDHGTHPGDGKPLTQADLYTAKHMVLGLEAHRKDMESIARLGGGGRG